MKKVNLSTTILSNVITFLVTLVIVTIGTWFLFTNIHSDARNSVVKDIQIVKTTVEPSKQ